MKLVNEFLNDVMDETKQHYADRMNTGTTKFPKLADTYIITTRLTMNEKLFVPDAQLVIDAASIKYINSELSSTEYMDIVQHIKSQIL